LKQAILPVPVGVVFDHDARAHGVSSPQLNIAPRRVHSATKAAKDLAGGFDGEESITEAIERYFIGES
jgi:hypothetical protein